MLSGRCLSDSITLLLTLMYVGWSLFVRQYHSTPGTWVCWVVFVCQMVYLYFWDLSMLDDLCWSDSITLLLGLEYVGWSLFVREYNSTPRIWVCWVVFACQMVYLYSWDLSMLGGLCLSDSLALLLEFEYVGWSLFVRWYNSTRVIWVCRVVFVFQTA